MSETTKIDAIEAPAEAEARRAAVRSYYGEELSRSEDLKTSACSTSAAPPPALAALVAHLHDETRARYFGCGLIAPEALEKAQVLDLGCGAGRDVYVLSQLVGPLGRVVGVDMTEEQLAVAERWREWHREKFEHPTSNVAFHQGYLEDLGAVGLEPASFDVVVSNCVINLATDKPATLAGVRRLLKPGGEFYFADVYADRPLSAAAQNDPVIYGECLGGALVWSDFVELAQEAGFAAPRVVTAAPIDHYSDDIKAAVAPTKFVSATVRLFAADAEARETDARRSLTYRGGLAAISSDAGDDTFAFASDVVFEKDQPLELDAATAELVLSSRFGRFFETTDAQPTDQAGRAQVVDPFRLAAATPAPAQNGCCG